MNQSDKERFEKLEQRLDKDEERLEKLERTRGETEPIKISRIEIDTGDTREMNSLLKHILSDMSTAREKLDTLDRGQQVIKQDIAAIHDVFVGDFERIEHSIGEVNATLSERFETNEQAVGAVQADVSNLNATLSERFETNEQAVGAVQADVSNLKATQTEHGQKLDEHGQKLDEQGTMLRQVLQILQQKLGE
jgi:LPS sulfotransferase NodH